jgi:hypothetical protein
MFRRKTKTTPKTDTDYKNNQKFSEDEQENYDDEDYVHVALIILKKAFNVTNYLHRQLVADFNAWQHANIYKIAEHICAEEPVFASPESINDEEPIIKKKVLKFWREQRLQEALQKMIEKARLHGWAIYYPINADKLFKGYSGPAWFVYSADEARPMEWLNGHPVVWDIKPTNKYLDSFRITISECVFYDPNNSDDHDGIPEGLAIWDALIDYEFIRDAVNGFDQRLGNGFLTVVAPASTSPTEMTTIKNAIKKIRTRKGLVIRGGMNNEEQSEITYQNMGGAQVDFISHLEKLEDLFSIALGLPKRWIKGDQEGAMESSGKDALQVNIKLRLIFKRWIPFIKNVLIFHNIISDYNAIAIRPGFELEMSEQERIQLDQIKTQTIAAKSWLTEDEKRELDGYPPMTEEQKNEKMNENNFQIGIGNNDKSNDDTSKNTEKTVQKVEKTDVKSLKFDDLFIKTDSVQINENLYEIQDVPLVLPQEKFYEEYNTTCVRPAAEIAKLFNDPKHPKEFRIGVTPSDDHSSKVPLEILKDYSVGTAKFTRIDEEGNIRGNIQVDLKSTEKILGADNWLKQTLQHNENPHTSVALYSRDEINEGKAIERDLDIRSFVFTRIPRNNNAGV